MVAGRSLYATRRRRKQFRPPPTHELCPTEFDRHAAILGEALERALESDSPTGRRPRGHRRFPGPASPLLSHRVFYLWAL